MTTYATTPKGRQVRIELGTLYGTSNQAYNLYYGCMRVAGWYSMSNCSPRNLGEALISADKYIDDHNITIEED